MALTKKKLFIFGILILALIIGVKQYYDSTPGKYDEVAKCLTEKGATFYGSYQCPHCTTQKSMFGKSMEYIRYIECGPLSGPMNQICTDAEIKGYPTWIIGDERLKGLQDIELLKAKTGC